jgi:hypothetical protein
MGKWVSDTKRGDGLSLNLLATEKWSIRYQGRVVSRCPCCDKPFPTPRTARLVADKYFPLPDDEPPAAA